VRPQTFDPAKAIRMPDGTVPALVDQATWDAVQVVLRRNQAQSIRSAKNPEAALLRGGFVRCGTRRRTLKVRPRSDGGVDYCCRQRRGLPCPRPTSITGSVLDPAVWGRVRAIVINPATVAREVERLRDNDPTIEDMRAVTSSLLEVERQRGNLVRAIAMVGDPDATAPLVSQFSDLTERHRVLRTEQAMLEQRARGGNRLRPTSTASQRGATRSPVGWTPSPGNSNARHSPHSTSRFWSTQPITPPGTWSLPTLTLHLFAVLLVVLETSSGWCSGGQTRI